MSVGAQTSKTQIDGLLSDAAVTLRKLASKASNMTTMLNSTGQLHDTLVTLGYGTAPNPENPGNLSDADFAVQVIGWMQTLSGIYYGTVRQGGDGTAGSAQTFNFHNALAPLWAGDIG